jgi:hypothetical protein
MAKKFKAAAARGEELGLTEDEIRFTTRWSTTNRRCANCR